MTNISIVDSFGDNGFSIARYYCFKHGRIPSCRQYNLIDSQKFIEAVIKEYPSDPAETIIEQQFSNKNKCLKYSLMVYPVTPDIYLYYDQMQSGQDVIEVSYSHDSDMNIVEKICELIMSFKEEYKADSNIHLLCYEHSSLTLKPFKLKVPEIDLTLNYNDDFIPIHDVILSRLNKPDEKGIVLLHGEPGNGKTTYVRHLATVLEKRLIYVPPDLTQKIASPEFLPLLMDYPNSILVIEDAENILRERQGGDNASISNLLNLSDGLLSDCLNIQLLCSFNADISKIDKALLRKGRIIAKYEFEPLKKEKAQALTFHLGQNRIISSPLSLADIYNATSQDFQEKEKTAIGFKHL